MVYDEVQIHPDDRDGRHVVASGPSQENSDVTNRQVGQALSASSDITTLSNIVYGAKLDNIATSSNTAYSMKSDNVVTSSNMAYGTKLDDIATSSNVAYSGMQLNPPVGGANSEDPDDGYELPDIEPVYDTCS